MIARKLVVLGVLVGGLFGLFMIPQQAQGQQECVAACEAADQTCVNNCDGNNECIAKCADGYVACVELCYKK